MKDKRYIDPETEKKKEEASRVALDCLAKGRKQFIESNLTDAAVNLQKAASIFEAIEDHKNYCEAMNVLGVVMGAAGNDTTALDHYLDGLEAANRYNIDVGSISILNNIGSKFLQLGANERALEYLLTGMKILESISIDSDDRLPSWKLIMELNICNAYRNLHKYETARRYMDLVDKYTDWVDGDENYILYYFSYKVSQANLNWDMGYHDEVRAALPELVQMVIKDGTVFDYVQDVESFMELLEKVGDRSHWEMVLQSFEQFANHQESLYFRMLSIENWLKFFKYFDMDEKYKEACVLYTEMVIEHSEYDKRDRVMALELKVTMREKDAATRKYETLANVDPLTGIGNRNKLEADSRTLLEEAKAAHSFIGIGLFDLDHFKAKNDAYGHIIGDACITCLIRALEKSLKSLEYAYRFGGDEFVVLIPNPTGEWIEDLAIRVKENLKSEQKKDKELRSIEEITLSQGYAFGIPEKGDSFMDILETADKALYHVKENGRDGYAIYGYTDIAENAIH